MNSHDPQSDALRMWMQEQPEKTKDEIWMWRAEICLQTSVN